MTFEQFLEAVRTLRVDRSGGVLKPYKPLLLASVVVLIHKGEILGPEIYLDGGLKSVFYQLLRTLYPGRADHPQAALARRQMSGGGTMLAFEVAGGKEAAFRMANALSIIGISNNLGDAKSLITHPETTTHQRLKPEQRAALGIGPGLLRLSVGLEDPDDLIEDLAQALDKAAGPRRQAAE